MNGEKECLSTWHPASLEETGHTRRGRAATGMPGTMAGMQRNCKGEAVEVKSSDILGKICGFCAQPMNDNETNTV